jgi:hypothetical protein
LGNDSLAIMRWASRNIWIPNLIGVGAAGGYLAWVTIRAIVEWVKAGGVQ